MVLQKVKGQGESAEQCSAQTAAPLLRRDDVEVWDDDGNVVEQEQETKRASLPKDIRQLFPACSYIHALGSKICQTLFFPGCGFEML